MIHDQMKPRGAVQAIDEFHASFKWTVRVVFGLIAVVCILKILTA